MEGAFGAESQASDTARLMLEILRGVVYLVFQVWEKLTANRIQLLLTEHTDICWGEEMRLGCH